MGARSVGATCAFADLKLDGLAIPSQTPREIPAHSAKSNPNRYRLVMTGLLSCSQRDEARERRQSRMRIPDTILARLTVSPVVAGATERSLRSVMPIQHPPPLSPK